MADHDSDSSGAEDVVTNVLLGYAARDPTSDDFSQLGGHPTWLDSEDKADGALIKCKVCNGLMNLLMQLNGDLPDRFPGHERRLYIWECRRKPCRRKNGSTRAMRATRQINAPNAKSAPPAEKKTETTTQPSSAPNLGDMLFGGKTATSASSNPFSTPASNAAPSNPFSKPSNIINNPPQPSSQESALASTFAEKVRLSQLEDADVVKAAPREPWPEESKFPEPYPSYHLDADKEYLEPEQPDLATSSAMRLDGDDEISGRGDGSSSAEDKAAFESIMDKTFQRFADRLAQNPEQVLRYEFDGQPLLHSRTDAVGKIFAPVQDKTGAKVKVVGGSAARIPPCGNCGAARVFEMQLTPHAITELEIDEMSVDGMDWGTVILGVCGKDCQEKGRNAGEVGYVEEWTGVQWEELEGKR